MAIKFSMHFIKRLYIFFLIQALIIFFFSTAQVQAKSFEIVNIEISRPFENNFDKNKVIDSGFEKAFIELIYSLVKSSDFKKIEPMKLIEIKSMIESFSIQEEKFVDQIYYVNLGVSFNKKKIFKFLNKKNIFPSRIVRENFLFIPIIIDESINDLTIFSNNPIYNNWNNKTEKYELINYLLPAEDLEDFNLIKEKIDIIETYDFKEITKKYFLKNSIISLIFKSKKEIRVLSKIYSGKKEVIKNNSFKSLDFNDEKSLNFLIDSLKISFEDTWKKINEINISIKLPIMIKMRNDDLKKSNNFELVLNDIELVNDYFVQKFDKEFIFYEVLYNGTVQSFINTMKSKNYKIDTQKKIWILE